MLTQPQSIALVIGLLMLPSCRTAGPSQTKDVFTATRDGGVMLFRGGSEKLTVRFCPNMAGLKPAIGTEAIEAIVAEHCPKISNNEIEFSAKNFRDFFLKVYQTSFMANGVSANPALNEIKNSIDQAASDEKAEVAAANQAASSGAPKLRDAININITSIESQLAEVNAFIKANPGLVSPLAQSKLQNLTKDLEVQKAYLAELSDDALAKVAQENLRSVESKKAQAWSDAYANFMDEIFLRPLFDNSKLVRLIETNPFEAQLITILSLYNQSSMSFVKIPAGTFKMGSPKDETGRDEDEGPQHNVTISKEFELQATELTSAQYHAIWGQRPARESPNKSCNDSEWVKQDEHGLNSFSWCPNAPIVNMRFDFVTKLLERLNSLSTRVQYRLPTEAEWEYAARAGTNGQYAGEFSRIAKRDSNGKIGNVASMEPNSWGLYDMHSNVWEWTSDTYRAPYEASDQVDPIEKYDHLRVVRGGSVRDPAEKCRSAFRHGVDYRDIDLDVRYFGVRLVREIKAP